MTQAQTQQPVKQKIQPTVGRIVLYTPDDSDLAARKGQPYPAVVTHVHSDDNVNLFVFPDDTFGLFGSRVTTLTSVLYDQGGAPGTWRWMPYQLGQAAKTQELENRLTAEATATATR